MQVLKTMSLWTDFYRFHFLLICSAKYWPSLNDIVAVCFSNLKPHDCFCKKAPFALVPLWSSAHGRSPLPTGWKEALSAWIKKGAVCPWGPARWKRVWSAWAASPIRRVSRKSVCVCLYGWARALCMLLLPMEGWQDPELPGGVGVHGPFVLQAVQASGLSLFLVTLQLLFSGLLLIFPYINYVFEK